MRAFSIKMICCLAVALLPSVVLAHAFLDHAEPKVGSTIGKSPEVVKVWFDQEVEPDFSTLVVRDSQGKQVDCKDTHRDDKEKKLLIVSLPPLADGDYSVTWSVVSTDTHHTHGEFKFTLKAGG